MSLSALMLHETKRKTHYRCLQTKNKQRIRHVRKDYNRTTHIVDIDYNHQAESTPLPREDKILQHPQPRANP